MRIDARDDMVLVTIRDPQPYDPHSTEPGDGGEFVLTSVDGIASRMELLGYDTIADALQAMAVMHDPTADNPDDPVWTDLYQAVAASCAAPSAAAVSTASDSPAPDPLTEARNTARTKLGLPPIQAAATVALAAVDETAPALPDGLADRVQEARVRFRRALSTPTI